MEKGFPTTTVPSYDMERARISPLARMIAAGGELDLEKPKPLTLKQKIDHWLIHDGYRIVFLVAFCTAHAMVFVFGFLNYYLKVGGYGICPVFMLIEKLG
jgi:hypothetical protein